MVFPGSIFASDWKEKVCKSVAMRVTMMTMLLKTNERKTDKTCLSSSIVYCDGKLLLWSVIETQVMQFKQRNREREEKVQHKLVHNTLNPTRTSSSSSCFRPAQASKSSLSFWILSRFGKAALQTVMRRETRDEEESESKRSSCFLHEFSSVLPLVLLTSRRRAARFWEKNKSETRISETRRKNLKVRLTFSLL